jgi:hypothetical protein
VVSVDGGATATYSYDHQNRRIKRTVGSTARHYVWQGSQVLAEHSDGTGAVITDYVYFGGQMIAKLSVGATQYFLSDRLSVKLVLDASGNVIGRQGHLPFGDEFAESGTQEKHHFTSYERDSEIGRLCDEQTVADTVGRFMQVDSIRGNIEEPPTPQILLLIRVSVTWGSTLSGTMQFPNLGQPGLVARTRTLFEEKPLPLICILN